MLVVGSTVKDETCVAGSEVATGKCTVLLKKLVSTDVVVGAVSTEVFFVVTVEDLDVVAEVGELLVTSVGTTEIGVKLYTLKVKISRGFSVDVCW